ncbi:peptidoglycan glycosyltransferase/peptidoglycan DD-transpeptidase MrcA [Moellerella wisconsensis]|uniref:Peptidoglycan glycosyltransferase/peptidoglycan DD-transpeptidase MrcA n=2 Tax=Moellerella wisconsensis TaxID=158849 RepID=A0ACD3Y761_9GAMM|nr:peptidoglycan glycosyltransferase/peptidoglycan DD-transpeptidase MrcA [Moellerella wisconsensis]KLN95505.1 penicillin-binding protein 1A [Moellerella wisconsensis]UNH27362.1 peptidoglycan glycosyltransferase/peptidoglycan DD-transpeptidase MrcA [Moellerella wisconsensis]UNH30817.1 peptidoglycan glycosyltransferase/peptidoglycan DD-transpeptidase MrcA [Moellerella wisconsensis]UNH38977.1 peptidoglycan glycosyltransferase/peptidoglycan DD-transpeptidase MrcA [Moellerella wisconsensis]WJW8195
MKFVKYLFIIVICCIVLGAASVFGMYKYVEAELPDVAAMKDIRLQTPMQIFSAEGELIAQYGEKRRIPLALNEIPPLMVHAFIATEDSRFYEHHGIDPIGIFRAVSVMATSGHASQGASTITQQLARNFYLSPEKTLMRKAKEAFLAIRIEQIFTKDEIMELYLNKIYLGNRAYGVGAAAYVYFGKSVNELTLSEIAMIAGLPKAPSTFNPLYSHERAVNRRNVVLNRMLEEKYIDQAQYEQAKSEDIEASYHAPKIDFSAPYLSEMARQALYEKYGEDAYTDGYKVYTTVVRKDQLSATDAVRNNLIEYDIRHGYRGPTAVLWAAQEPAWDAEKITSVLKKSPVYGPLMPAVVMSADANQAQVMLADGSTEQISLAGVRWARKFISDHQQGPTPRSVDSVVKAGEQVWVRQVKDSWWLAQVPDVNGALIALNPHDGAIIALVGGFDFNMSEFNRVTQSLRQVGSNIKPFLYTAAMDKGLTLASLLNDVPISRWDAGAGSDWRPKNSPPRYDGPIRLRQGLGQSKNVVMVRAMRAMGVDYAADYLTRFGFPRENIVRTEALALGAPSFTPMQMARGFAVMSNGGYLVDPYFISKIENSQNEIVFEAKPKIACPECTDIPVIYGETEKSIDNNIVADESVEDVAQSDKPVTVVEPQAELDIASLDDEDNKEQQYAPHVISTPLAFLIRDAMMTNIYGEPGWSGTGWRAARDLNNRRDIGGKTGTTNSSKDAWFSGYGPGIVATTWIGFDDNKRSLGRTAASGGEAGAKSAQPIWDDFMKVVLEGVPQTMMAPPKGIISVTIDRKTGKLATGSSSSTRKEYFIEGTEPKDYAIEEVGTSIFEDNGESQELF